jgi:hypothetical protein
MHTLLHNESKYCSNWNKSITNFRSSSFNSSNLSALFFDGSSGPEEEEVDVEGRRDAARGSCDDEDSGAGDFAGDFAAAVLDFETADWSPFGVGSVDIGSEVDVVLLSDSGTGVGAASGDCGGIAAGDVCSEGMVELSSFLNSVVSTASTFSVSAGISVTSAVISASSTSAGLVARSVLSSLSSSNDSSCSGAGDNSERGEAASSSATGSSAGTAFDGSAGSGAGSSMGSSDSTRGLVAAVGPGEPECGGGDNEELLCPFGVGAVGE